MSTIATLLRRLVRRSAATSTTAPSPDCMSLRDWADLPSYHPRPDRAPC